MQDNKKLFQTTLFKVAILAPVTISICVALAIYSCNELSDFLMEVWKDYKIPMTIASLFIPFAALVTANHRSEQSMKGLELQHEKRLYDIYYEQQKHFEKVMGRRIKNAKFEYIKEEDLPVIFSELYEFNRIQQKDEVSLKIEAIKDIDRFLKNTREIIEEFYVVFSEHKEKSPDQKRVLDSFIIQMFTHLQNNLHKLSNDIGVRYIDLSDIGVEVSRQAYLEVLQLTYYMGDDFKSIWDVPVEEDGNTPDMNIRYTFNAIEEIIRSHMEIGGSATYSNITSSMSLREVIKISEKSSLQKVISDLFNELLEKIKTHCEFDDIYLIEGKYEKYQFPSRENCPTLELWFDEISDLEGDLVLTTPDIEYKARVIIVDEKIIVNGNDNIKYSIDSDMGARFIQDCIKSTSMVLNNFQNNMGK